MSFFLYLALTLVVLALAAVFVGSRLPKTHMAASRIRLSAPPEDVFAILTDFEAYPSWRPGLAKVERGPEFDGLPSWYEVCTTHSRMHFRVVESEPPSRLVTGLVSEKLPLSGAWIYRIEPDGYGTILTITETENIHHPLLRFFDRFVLRYFGVMDVYLIALAVKLGDPPEPEHLSLKLENEEPTS